MASIFPPKYVGNTAKIWPIEKNVYGEACRQWRVNKGLSQEYMATQLGLRDAKAYQRYEAGESALTIPMLESIAKWLRQVQYPIF